MKRISFIVIAFLLFSCQRESQRIVQPKDYASFLQPGLASAEIINTQADLRFWENRLQQTGINYVDLLQMAYARLRLFGLTRDVSHLTTGDSLLKKSSSMLGNSDPDILFALCQNAISQHMFNGAAEFNSSAKQVNGDPYISKLLEFDTRMELGNFGGAEKSLASLTDKKSFDYLVRASKLADHHGRQEESIYLMEQAFEKIENRGGTLYAWVRANLGDMYGHAGRVEEAYEAYLDALQKDSACLHALRGIAWIAYSHDQDAAEAKRIIRFIQSQESSPETWLDLAEIAAWEENHPEKEMYVSRFVEEVSDPSYGDMYNKYLVMIYKDHLKDPATALRIAEKEIVNRRTPQTYSWLAGAWLAMGEPQKALTIINNYVYRRTSEPAILYQCALVFAANDRKEEAKRLFMECLESDFELGPVTAKEIKAQLALIGD